MIFDEYYYPYTIRKLKDLDENSKEYKLTIKKLPIIIWKKFSSIDETSENMRKKVHFYYVLTISFLLAIVIFFIFLFIAVEIGPDTEEILDEEIILLVQYVTVYICLMISILSVGINYRKYAYQYLGYIIDNTEFKKLDCSMEDLENIECILHKDFKSIDEKAIIDNYLEKVNCKE